MFERLEMAPPDPILGLTDAFKDDPNPNKINLGVGIYKDEAGKTPIFTAVKKAEKKLVETEATKNYLPISGPEEYAAVVQEMVFGKNHEIVTGKRASTAQTPGGTGALRVAGDFLKKCRPNAKVWVSNPTWTNHYGVFQAAGFEVKEYPYYNAAEKALDFNKMIEGLKAVPEGDIILLHACCHNPTGIDPTVEQWSKIAQVMAERNLFAMVDFAYQGFGNGLEEDAAGVRELAKKLKEMLVASSYSKNFGLYNERVGALTLVAESADAAKKAFSHIKTTIRQIYSNPPYHGGAIVSTIWNDPALRTEWETELAQTRGRIHEMRKLFVDTLKAKGIQQDFSFIARQVGMFSFSGLSKDQVEQLKKKYAIYIVGSGRINVAGMTKKNMEPLCQALAEILKS